MRTLIASTLVVALAASLGACASSTVHGEKGEKLTLFEPANQTLKRGETNEISLTLDGDNASGPLKVSFDNLPDGVRVVEEDRMIPATNNFVTFTLYAADDAVLVQKNTVTVKLESSKGLVASQFFHVDVVQ